MTITRGQVALLAGFSALAPMAIDMYLPAMTPLAADLSVSVEHAGQSISVFLLGIAGGQLVAGPLSDRLGRRPLFLSGLCLFTLAAIVAALTSSFIILLAARLVQALGACAAMVTGRAIVRDRMNATESARFFSMLALIGGLAPILAPLLGTLLIQVGDWRLTFWVMAGFAALLLTSGTIVMPESRSAETASKARDEHPFAAYAALLGNRRLLGYLLAATCNSAAFFSYVANSSVVLVDGYGLSPAQFSLIFGVNSLALVGTAQINRIMLKNGTPDTMLRLSARNALILAALVAVFAATGLGGMWALLVLLFFMVGSITPVQANAMAGGLAVDGLRAGSTAALFGAATFAGGSVASLVAGSLYDGTGGGLCTVVAVCLVGVALAIRLIVLREAAQPA